MQKYMTTEMNLKLALAFVICLVIQSDAEPQTRGARLKAPSAKCDRNSTGDTSCVYFQVPGSAQNMKSLIEVQSPMISASNRQQNVSRDKTQAATTPIYSLLLNSRQPSASVTWNTDAIHKTLSTEFSFTDEKIITTMRPSRMVPPTSSPIKVAARLNWPSTPTPELRDSAADHTKKMGQLVDLINNVVKSIRSTDLPANRATRLAPGPELADLGLESGKLVLGPDKQPATSEDVHLLCKLLHKHLQLLNATAAISSLPLTTSPQPPTARSTALETTTTSSTPVPKRVDDFPTRVFSTEDLGAAHESYLLESIFSFDSRAANGTNGDGVELLAERIMLNLYNAAAAALHNKRLANRTGPGEYDEEASDLDESNPPLTIRAPLMIRALDRLTQVSRTRLQLVYWLLEPPHRQQPNNGRPAPLRILKPQEALDLLDQLDQRKIQRQLDRSKLSALVLVGQYNRTYSITESDRSEPQVVDDSLTAVDNQEKNHSERTGLQRFVDKLTNSTFTDNLYLYLILIAFLLLILVLCFACPLLCCRQSSLSRHPAARPRRRPSSASAHQRGHATPERHSTGVTVKGVKKHDLLSPAQLLGQFGPDGQNFDCSDSIWRKLSASSTTLVQDESHTLKSEAALPVLRESDQDYDQDEETQPKTPSKSQFEWYSFEQERKVNPTLRRSANRLTQTDTDQQSHKSVQTGARSRRQVDEQLTVDSQLECREHKSDTLSKSELVMIKEKLVPIAATIPKTQQPEVAAQASIDDDLTWNTSASAANYVNQSSFPGSILEWPPAQTSSMKHIDTSSSSPTSAERRRNQPMEQSQTSAMSSQPQLQPAELMERRPKMRHVELPPRTRAKVDAIKNELARLEKEDSEQQLRYRI